MKQDKSWFKMKKERDFVKLNLEEVELLRTALGLKKMCYYCKKKIKNKEIFSIYNMPDRLICNDVLCIIKAIDEDEK